jgi:hypothetical protein
VVSQSPALTDLTSSTFQCLCLSTRIWSNLLWVFPSGDIQVYLWRLWCGNIILLAKFTHLTPLSLVILYKLSFPIVGLKSLPSLLWQFNKHVFQFLIADVLHIISFIFCWGMNIQNNDITSASSLYYLLHPITTTLNPLNCWYDSLMQKKKKNMYLIHDSHSPFLRKMCILPRVRSHHPPIRPSALLLNLTYIWLAPLPMSLGSLPYTDSLHSIIDLNIRYRHMMQYKIWYKKNCAITYCNTHGLY